MTTRLKDVMEEAKHLNASDRALMARLLISSLDTEGGEGVDQAWLELAERRFDELTSGAVKAVSWEQIEQKIRLN